MQMFLPSMHFHYLSQLSVNIPHTGLMSGIYVSPVGEVPLHWCLKLNVEKNGYLHSHLIQGINCKVNVIEFMFLTSDATLSDTANEISMSQTATGGIVKAGGPKFLLDHEYHEISDEEGATESPRFEVISFCYLNASNW